MRCKAYGKEICNNWKLTKEGRQQKDGGGRRQKEDFKEELSLSSFRSQEKASVGSSPDSTDNAVFINMSKLYDSMVGVIKYNTLSV